MLYLHSLKIQINAVPHNKSRQKFIIIDRTIQKLTHLGTPPNLVLKSVFEKTFKEVPEEEQVINYQTWLEIILYYTRHKNSYQKI